MTVLPQDIGNTSCLKTSVTLNEFGVVRGVLATVRSRRIWFRLRAGVFDEEGAWSSKTMSNASVSTR